MESGIEPGTSGPKLDSYATMPHPQGSSWRLLWEMDSNLLKLACVFRETTDKYCPLLEMRNNFFKSHICQLPDLCGFICKITDRVFYIILFPRVSACFLALYCRIVDFLKISGVVYLFPKSTISVLNKRKSETLLRYDILYLI